MNLHVINISYYHKLFRGSIEIHLKNVTLMIVNVFHLSLVVGFNSPFDGTINKLLHKLQFYKHYFLFPAYRFDCIGLKQLMQFTFTGLHKK